MVPGSKEVYNTAGQEFSKCLPLQRCTLLVETLVLPSGLTLVVLCPVDPGLAQWENSPLSNLLRGPSQSVRPYSYDSRLPSGAGLKPRVCLRHQTMSGFLARLVQVLAI